MKVPTATRITETVTVAELHTRSGTLYRLSRPVAYDGGFETDHVLIHDRHITDPPPNTRDETDVYAADQDGNVLSFYPLHTNTDNRDHRHALGLLLGGVRLTGG